MKTVAVGVAALLLSSTASAQYSEGERVVLHADPKTHSTLYSFDGAVVIDTCDGDCTFVLPHGRYRLEVEETDVAPARSEVIGVYRPTDVNVTSGSKKRRALGLTLGIVGAVALPVGLVGLYFAEHGYCADCHSTNTDVAVWGLIAAAGAALTITGFTVFSRSATKVRQTPPFDVAVVPTKNGAWSGVKIMF